MACHRAESSTASSCHFRVSLLTPGCILEDVGHLRGVPYAGVRPFGDIFTHEPVGGAVSSVGIGGEIPPHHASTGACPKRAIARKSQAADVIQTGIGSPIRVDGWPPGVHPQALAESRRQPAVSSKQSRSHRNRCGHGAVALLCLGLNRSMTTGSSSKRPLSVVI